MASVSTTQKPDAGRNDVVSSACTDEEKQLIRRAAKLIGYSVSDLLRRFSVDELVTVARRLDAAGMG